MWEYRLAQEFIGSDQGNAFIQDSKVGNVQSEFLPETILPVTKGNPGLLTIGSPCPSCGSVLESFEFQGRFLENRQEIYKCRNCGTTNDPYKRNVTKRKRLRKRRAFANTFLKQSSGLADGHLSGTNPANQPLGRLDLSQDERVIPWHRIEDGFREEFDHQKQKKNFKYKLVKRKNENGEYEIVRIKVKDTFGDAVQPSNIMNERGRIKKQPRYNPLKNRNKNKADGSWPHNRNTGTEGWYGQGDPGSNVDADMRYRVMKWDDFISERASFMTNLTRF